MIGTILENKKLLLSKKINDVLGLYFPANRWRDLERGLRNAGRELGYNNFEHFTDWLLLSNNLTFEQIQTLARYLTIGETYFFRDKKLFRIVEKNILQPLMESRGQSNKTLRIWSAGCSSGEEAYTIAIILDNLIPDIQSWQIKILATDINPKALEKAKKGHYSNWSFRQTPQNIMRKYFKKLSKNTYEIAPAIKNMVSFRSLNLATNDFPSLLNDTISMDVIFCRNVLMYFKTSLAMEITKKFHRSLTEGGWLVLSPVEAPVVPKGLFDTDSQHSPGVFSKKGTASSRTTHNIKRPVIHKAAKHSFLSTGTQQAGRQQKDVPNLTGHHQSAKSSIAIKDNAPGEIPDSYKLSLSLFHSGRYKEALILLTELLETVTDDKVKAKVYALRARIYANQGKLEDAYRCCENALKHDKLNPHLHYLYATIVQEFGQIDEAITSLRKAIYLYPDYVIAHFALGNLLKQKGDETDWSKSYENVLTLIQTREPDELIPGSEGMTVNGLKEIIETIL